MITEADIAVLTDRCRDLPKTDNVHLATDFVSCLRDTVIDFQQHTTTVRRAIAHFNEYRWNELRTLDDLQTLCDRYPDERSSNTELAEYLWGYKMWTRARMFRGLTDLFASTGVRDLDSLRRWAEAGSFKAVVEGRVRGLGPTVYNWLVMRLGRRDRQAGRAHPSLR